MPFRDAVVLVLYLAGVLAVGIRTRRRRSDEDDFLLAGRRMGAVPLGLSVMVTLFSAINVTAFPTEIATHGLYAWVSVPVFLLAAWPVSRWFIPWFRAQPGTDGYAWLEARHGVEPRRAASALFLLWRLAWMATALFATGRIAGPLIGVPAAWVMIGAAALSLAYTSLGGLRAVIWTDVLQFIVLCGGLLLAVTVAFVRAPGGFFGVVSAGRAAGVFRPFMPGDSAFWSWDPTLRITFWSGIMGTGVAFLARYAADQMILQRYRAARDLGAAQRSIWINAWAAVFVMLLLSLLGLATAVTAGSEHLPPAARMAALFRSLPGGAAGLIAAGLLAATMSSLDSGLHACAATWGAGMFPRRLHRAARLPPRVVMVAIALAALLLALPMGRLGGLFAVVNKVINGLGAPLLGLVLCGLCKRGFNGPGLAWGAVTGFAFSVVHSVAVTDLALHHYAVVNLLVTLLLCRAFSAVAGRTQRNDLRP